MAALRTEVLTWLLPVAAVGEGCAKQSTSCTSTLTMRPWRSSLPGQLDAASADSSAGSSADVLADVEVEAVATLLLDITAVGPATAAVWCGQYDDSRNQCGRDGADPQDDSVDEESDSEEEEELEVDVRLCAGGPARCPAVSSGRIALPLSGGALYAVLLREGGVQNPQAYPGALPLSGGALYAVLPREGGVQNPQAYLFAIYSVDVLRERGRGLGPGLCTVS